MNMKQLTEDLKKNLYLSIENDELLKFVKFLPKEDEKLLDDLKDLRMRVLEGEIVTNYKELKSVSNNSTFKVCFQNIFF